MPIRSNQIRRQTMPLYHESSYQRSPRDSDGVARAWMKHKQLAEQVRSLTEAVKQLQWQMNHLRLRKGTAEGGVASICPYG
jgi:hypothetical protein